MNKNAMAHAGGALAAVARRGAWRLVLGASGGLRVEGRPPDRPCVLVANHASHADTAALFAALPARRRPVVAAAADYWFARSGRAAVCRMLVGGFPVRRSGGGSADLAVAERMLEAGRDVIIYPEGTRSRDGSIGEFHSGASRLAARTGAPLVPVGIAGTRELLPAQGRVRRSRVTVRIGAPINEFNAAREAVAGLVAAPSRHRQLPRMRPDSRLRQALARLARSRLGLAVTAGWAFAEALSWPLLPEYVVCILVLACPRATLRLALASVAGSLVGGTVMYALAVHGATPPAPLTTPRMYATTAAQVADEGARAVRHQPLSGIPYKVYATAAGEARVGLPGFVGASATARGSRILIVGLVAGLVGVAVHRWRRWYPLYLTLFVTGFGVAFAAVVASWK